jgi:hypothetical protein
MADLRTRYLGMELRSPLVASSSPLTGSLDGLRRLEAAGAGAVVLPSLFEEELATQGPPAGAGAASASGRSRTRPPSSGPTTSRPSPPTPRAPGTALGSRSGHVPRRSPASGRISSGWTMASCWAMEPPVEMPWTQTRPGNLWPMAPSTNRLLVSAVAVEFLALLGFVYLGPMQALLGHEPLTLGQWLPVLLVAAEETRKAVVRRRRRGGSRPIGPRPAGHQPLRCRAAAV